MGKSPDPDLWANGQILGKWPSPIKPTTEAVTLSDEALEGVSGGYLYYDAPTRMWRIIDDTTGLTKGQEAELFEAKDVAQSLGFSDVQISWEQLNRLRKGQAI